MCHTQKQIIPRFEYYRGVRPNIPYKFLSEMGLKNCSHLEARHFEIKDLDRGIRVVSEAERVDFIAIYRFK